MSCSSTPEPVEEEQPVEETVAEPQQEPVPEEVVEMGQAPVEAVVTPVVEPVSREELMLARQSLQRAQEAEASRFAPELMKEAYNELKEATNLAESDPEKSRALLAGVIDKGDRAFELGKAGLIAEALSSMTKMDASLKDIEADKFSPEAYQEVKRQFDAARKLIKEEKFIEAREAYSVSSVKAKNLHRQLSENIRWVGILERDTENYLADAEKAEAYIWADKEFIEASDILSRGMTSFRQYDLKSSEARLKEARFKARGVIYLANTRKKQKETDALLQQIQNDLEEASTLMIQTEEGDILEADPWSGRDFLNENPLLEAQAENYTGENSKLLEYDLDKSLDEDVEIVEEEEEETASDIKSQRTSE